MILIDLNQVMISNLFANIGTTHDINENIKLPDKQNIHKFPGKPGITEVNEDLIRHMVLNSLR